MLFRSAPIAASYLFLGRQLVAGMGQSTAAREFAARRFPALVADTESRPETVLTRFLSAQGAISRLAYYGAPLLLLLSLTLQAMRPKPIRSFGGRG